MLPKFKLAWAGVMGGAILLGPRGVCLAATDDASYVASDGGSNPYSVIVDRNVFHLNPPPPPPDNSGPPPDLPVVNLSGFVHTADKLKVLLAVRIKSKVANVPDSITYLSLTEGDKDGEVELVKVYEAQAKVDIINSGTPMTLSMKDNGFESHAPPAGAGQRVGAVAMRQIPGAPQTPQVGLPGQIQAVPQGQNYENPGGGGSTIVGGSPIIAGGAAYNSYNRGAVNNGNPAGGGAVINSGYQAPQAASYGSSSRPDGGVISGGATPFNNAPPRAQQVAIPLTSPNDLSRLTQPNSTPAGDNNPNVEMPPLP